MRVVVDDSAAFNQGAGIGRYARQVVPAATRCLPGARFRLVYAPSRSGIAPYGEATMQAFDPGQEVNIRRLPFSRRRADQLWFRAGLPVPLQLFAGSTDLVYSPDFTAPPAGCTPRLITIHDLAFLVAPAHAPERLRRYLAQVVPRQVSRAARVLTVSQTTRDDLIERYNVDAQRIAVVPNGVEERFFTA